MGLLVFCSGFAAICGVCVAYKAHAVNETGV
jgi:hypothetical protein